MLRPLLFLAVAGIVACDSAGPGLLIEATTSPVEVRLIAGGAPAEVNLFLAFTKYSATQPTFRVTSSAPEIRTEVRAGYILAIWAEGEVVDEVRVVAEVEGQTAELRVPVRAATALCADPPSGTTDYFALPDGDITFDLSRTLRGGVYPAGHNNEDLVGRVVWSVSSSCRLGVRSMTITETVDAIESSSYLQVYRGDTLQYRTTGPTSIATSQTMTIELGERIPSQIGEFWSLNRVNASPSPLTPERFRPDSGERVVIKEQLQAGRVVDENYQITLRRQGAPEAFRRELSFGVIGTSAPQTTTTTLTRVE